MHHSYTKLLTSKKGACQGGTPLIFTERHLQAVWLEQKYFRDLKTYQGGAVRVLSPGIWNAEAGPDFRKAHLQVAGNNLLGDVEIHLRESDWYNHQHHQDSRYNEVVFHLALWRATTEKLLFTSAKKQILQACIEPYLTVPISRLVKLIDLDLYPYQRFVGSGRCAQELFRSMSKQEIVKFFQKAALWRLKQKSIYLKSIVNDPQYLMGAGIAMGLGYKHNTATFQELFSWMLTHRDLPEDQLLSLSMGVCGFFEERFLEKWQDSSYYQLLKSLWWGQQSAADHQAQLHLHQVRPLNHPVRRLVYMTKMLRDPQLEHLFERMESHWVRSWLRCPKWTVLRAQLIQLLPEYKDPYWNRHYTFETGSREGDYALVGADLKQEILVNTFLPLLYDTILNRQNECEMTAFENFYFSFPSVSSSKSKYLMHRFFGDTSKGKLLKKAMASQGSFQLHRDFCIHYEASCEGCPFVDRFKENSNPDVYCSPD